MCISFKSISRYGLAENLKTTQVTFRDNLGENMKLALEIVADCIKKWKSGEIIVWWKLYVQ